MVPTRFRAPFFFEWGKYPNTRANKPSYTFAKDPRMRVDPMTNGFSAGIHKYELHLQFWSNTGGYHEITACMIGSFRPTHRLARDITALISALDFWPHAPYKFMWRLPL